MIVTNNYFMNMKFINQDVFYKFFGSQSRKIFIKGMNY